MAWSTKLSGQILAAAASGILGIGVMNQVVAQDDAEPASPPAQQSPDDAQQDEAQQDEAQQDEAQRRDPQADAPRNNNQDNSTDDSPPNADDLNFDDQGSDDQDPPAIPRDDNERGDQRNDRRDRNFDDDRISPSDRTLNGREKRLEDRGVRSDVRRFDYEDSTQPVPEDQASGAQSQGHANYGRGCATHRVYHNSCGGCGQSYGYGGSSGYQNQGYQQNYQTRSHNPHRAVIGVTVENWEDSVQVLDVAPNSPAEQAGLQTGDRIVALDGREVRSSQAMVNHLRRLNSGRQVSLTIDRAGDRHELDSQIGRYSQVFGNGRGNVASNVPSPPQQDRFAQSDQPRTAFRPDYEAADNDGERLDRVQMRIGQLERELKALRKEEQDLRNITRQDEAGRDKAVDSAADDSTVDEIAPPADTPTPADDNADDSGEVPVDDSNNDLDAPDAVKNDDAENADDSNDSSTDDDNEVEDDEADDDDQSAAPAQPSNRERIAPSVR